MTLKIADINKYNQSLETFHEQLNDSLLWVAKVASATLVLRVFTMLPAREGIWGRNGDKLCPFFGKSGIMLPPH